LPVEYTNDIGMKFRFIPPGEFMMGAGAEEQSRFLKEARDVEDEWALRQIPNEGPQHRVRITVPFYLGNYEVSRGEFRRFVEAASYETEAERDGKGGSGIVGDAWVEDPRFVWNRDPGFPQADEHPVVNVTWNDAEAFCQWLTNPEDGVQAMLPTEAQWEFACRAGSTTFWYCGPDDAALLEHAWFGSNSDGRTHPVGELRSNAFGLHDMHGNVWEWCYDWQKPFQLADIEDPNGPPTGSLHMFRGGSWYDSAAYCRSANRSGHGATVRFNLGFRVALSLDGVKEKLVSQRN
jgi:formylglycine-generating enzyme required for sulfatase activity